MDILSALDGLVTKTGSVEVAAVEMAAESLGEFIAVVNRAISGKIACSQVTWLSVKGWGDAMRSEFRY